MPTEMTDTTGGGPTAVIVGSARIRPDLAAVRTEPVITAG
jgi:hypothetical protein